MRSVLELDWGADLARSPEVRRVLAEVGFPGAFCVRGVLFDKHAGANWKVPWHQDRKIAVRERIEVEGFRGWSVKEGMVHCQPTGDVLESMVTVRLHLDDCGPQNGPLKVVARSHRHGLLTIGASLALAEAGPVVTVTCKAGDAVVMSPLLLHASSQAEVVGHRRVLHLEFATGALPGGLAWHRAV
jgi:ectoine hydroxylase-related dioxygenase (phytanoyl-CoA dioxygenase family)